VVAAYDHLATSVEFLASFTLLRFTEGALDRFEGFKKMKLGVRGQDLRIAAIALEQGGTLVTRNVRDFQRIVGLVVEDWSRL
jgi:tRNA(fMet)-specific endonuclease VapC